MRKPTGKIGQTLLSSEKVDFEPIPFPNSKQEIEKFIGRVFLQNSDKLLPFKLIGYGLNDIDDFDFNLNTSEGLKYLELMEIAPLEHLRGSYDNVPNSYKPYEFAKYIFFKISTKSKRYSGVKKTDIYLLTYITHWAFIVSNTVSALLCHWLSESESSFKGAFIYSPINATEGIIQQLIPKPSNFPMYFDPEKYKNNIVHNIPPFAWKQIKQ